MTGRVAGPAAGVEEDVEGYVAVSRAGGGAGAGDVPGTRAGRRRQHRARTQGDGDAGESQKDRGGYCQQIGHRQ